MTIRPAGGWMDTPQENQPTNNFPGEPDPPAMPPPLYRPAYRQMGCKVCDTGSLRHTKKFRMSGPAVVIGFILLIPSILGILFSAVMFVGVNATAVAVLGSDSSSQTEMLQTAFEKNFRRDCAAEVNQEIHDRGATGIPTQWVKPYCECTLAEYKRGGAKASAAHADGCGQKALDGTLKPISEETSALYSPAKITPKPQADDLGVGLFQAFGSATAVVIGLASFVGGLLGWLLVMRKRVLQCDFCGAVVSAS